MTHNFELPASPLDHEVWDFGFDTAALEGYLTRTLPGFRGPLTVHAMEGPRGEGACMLSTPTTRYVLRTAMRVGLAAIDQEFRVLAALAQRGFPVPRPLLFCDQNRVIGAAFYVTARPAGRIFHESAIPGVSAGERAALYDAMNATLAQLHMFDPAALGLSGLGGGRHYMAEETARWTRVYFESCGDEIAEMDRLMVWLPQNLPAERVPRLVHGDFRLEKIVFHPVEAKVAAVLDTELATVGDPVADAVYHFIAWIMIGSGGGTGAMSETELADLGIPTLEDYAGLYSKRVGLRTIPSFETYFAYNLFRMAALIQSSARQPRGRTGRPRAAPEVRPLAALAWSFARRAGAE